ncbi:PREDICTED: tripartite motif-containing protein 10-like [Tinamus guttatus]|uniref:tripartite motif-containing protein 10-like n=1 Tax=Tinamus guttatus TaxID=94827 RepID=UPI00052F3BD8|nr:PREDICTED: tripartite motif-containing protein 10-like [Tinamus guttatus]
METANVTLDPATAHPRLVLSADHRSVRWEYLTPEPPSDPRRFRADPCGLYCAVGVSRESPARKSGAGFSPAEGIWAVQQWGFQNRALTEPPTLLALPRVPRRIRVSLDYEWGEVAFWDAESRDPIFTFPPAAFAGERVRPWFWLELGSLSLAR